MSRKSLAVGSCQPIHSLIGQWHFMEKFPTALQYPRLSYKFDASNTFLHKHQSYWREKQNYIEGLFLHSVNSYFEAFQICRYSKGTKYSFLHKIKYLMNDKTTNICVIHSRSYLTQSAPYSDVLKEPRKKVSTNICLPKLSLADC